MNSEKSKQRSSSIPMCEKPSLRPKTMATTNIWLPYFVPKQGHLPTTNALRSFLSEKLPQHVVPSAFVALDSLPYLPSGKVDRRSLPSADPPPAKLDKLFVAPRNSLELELTRIWQAITKVPNIGVTDNFFDFGADSLTAVRLISEIKKSFIQATVDCAFPGSHSRDVGKAD